MFTNTLFSDSHTLSKNAQCLQDFLQALRIFSKRLVELRPKLSETDAVFFGTLNTPTNGNSRGWPLSLPGAG